MFLKCTRNLSAQYCNKVNKCHCRTKAAKFTLKTGRYEHTQRAVGGKAGVPSVTKPGEGQALPWVLRLTVRSCSRKVFHYLHSSWTKKKKKSLADAPGLVNVGAELWCQCLCLSLLWANTVFRHSFESETCHVFRTTGLHWAIQVAAGRVLPRVLA